MRIKKIILYNIGPYIDRNIFDLSSDENRNIVLIGGKNGAGKTTFTQYVFSFLGVKEYVNSPTFSILKTYIGNHNIKLNHFDTYRISDEEAIEVGFDEVLDDKNSITFIEWGENISSLLPSKRINIDIKIIDENTREIEINK